MKLFKVKCEIYFDVLVVAEDVQTARRLAHESFAREEMNDNSQVLADGLSIAHASELTELKQVPEEWLGSSLYRQDGKLQTPEDFFAKKGSE